MGEGKLTPLTTPTPLNRQSRNIAHVITPTISPHVPHLVKIAPGVTSPHIAKVTTQFFYRQACALRSHAGIVFTQWSKMGSSPRHVAPINVKFGTPVPNLTFIGKKMWEYSPQNCQNFEFWQEICTSGATRLQYFNEILSVCTRL